MAVYSKSALVRGRNLPFYSPNVRHLIGLDPSPKLLSMARRNSSPNFIPIELIEGSAEAIPLESESVDTVVTTWTLCTIPKPSGRLLFVEHGRAPQPNVHWW